MTTIEQRCLNCEELWLRSNNFGVKSHCDREWTSFIGEPIVSWNTLIVVIPVVKVIFQYKRNTFTESKRKKPHIYIFADRQWEGETF